MTSPPIAADRGAIGSIFRRLDAAPLWIAEIFLRIGPALIFWRSGRQKLASWDTTRMLFRDEYQVPLLPPELAASLATGIELVAPIMLVLGLGARFGAAALLAMTIVIQFFVYPGSYPDHLLWAGPLLYILLRGPGTLSIDYLIRKRLAARTTVW